jgi:hypothetical protein
MKRLFQLKRAVGGGPWHHPPRRFRARLSVFRVRA